MAGLRATPEPRAQMAAELHAQMAAELLAQMAAELRAQIAPSRAVRSGNHSLPSG